jgi:hypothetical protein
MVGRYDVPVHGCNDAGGLGELVHVVGSAPRRKHVMGQVGAVVPHPVVGIGECLHMLSIGFVLANDVVREEQNFYKIPY